MVEKEKDLIKVAEVALTRSIPTTLLYSIPQEIRDTVQIGTRVIVPLKNQRVVGYVLNTTSMKDGEHSKGKRGEFKPVLDVIDQKPIFPEEMVSFFQWIAHYYIYPIGEVIKTAIPGKIKSETNNSKYIKTRIHFCKSTREPILNGRHTKTRNILEFIRAHHTISYDELRQQFGYCRKQLRYLAEEGIIKIVEEPRSDLLSSQSLDIHEEHYNLTKDQARTIHEIGSSIGKTDPKPFLLYGVTGSGKTRIYIELVKVTLERGKGAIVLVPEIALTPQLIAQFRAHFPYQIAIMHSKLSQNERWNQWMRVLQGDSRVVVGVRSAIFAPMKNLGIIVVDEEHDPSYKQENNLRYNARDLALVRGKEHGALVVLGSATPSLESYKNCLYSKYQFIHIKERVKGGKLPKVTVVDMRKEVFLKGRKNRFFSQKLIQGMNERFERGEQVILFLNRRGFFTHLICNLCGFTLKCPHCEISLVYHQDIGDVVCHICNYRTKQLKLCPQCKQSYINMMGFGTQRVEDEVKELISNIKTVRLDSDAVARRGAAKEFLGKVLSGETNVLVGTQMVAKGHDLKGVTLVGVILADLSMNIPDFRAAERTFQILSQVAGRAGRGDKPGEIIIQTYNPDHYSIQLVKRHDYLMFANKEMRIRKKHSFPPFGRLVNLRVVSSNKDELWKYSERLFELCDRIKKGNFKNVPLDILGPAESPLPKLKGKYRVNLTIRGKSIVSLHTFITKVLKRQKEIKGFPRITLTVDVDPVTNW
ncbi:MAG: primosomal protein N' [Thermodesulfobacteriota bacterium]|nr:primosomal protein N' [Thermodesulfobacteriota bacterium]